MLQTTQHPRDEAVTAVWHNVQIESTPPLPEMGHDLPCWWTIRPCRPAEWLVLLLIKARETNPGQTTTRKQVRIYTICHM